MLSCKQISEMSDEFLDGGLGFYQRLKIRIHLAMCRNCSRYIRQSKLLVGTVRQLCGSASSSQVNKIMHAIKTETTTHENEGHDEVED